MATKLSFDEQIAHLVYDLSLPLPERRERVLRFPSALKAAAWLGMGNPNKIPYYTSPRLQRRYYSQKHGKEFAIRVAKSE